MRRVTMIKKKPLPDNIEIYCPNAAHLPVVDDDVEILHNNKPVGYGVVTAVDPETRMYRIETWQI